MKKLSTLAICAAILAAGCAKESDGNVEKPHTRISVGINEQTKTALGDLDDGKRPIYWTNGDRIAINGTASLPLAGLQTPSSTASFDFEALLDTPYNILYPASIYKDASNVTLPGVVEDQVFPLGGQGLSVEALTSVLRLNIVKGSHEATLKKIVVTSKGGVQLCGPFTIDYAAASLSGTDPSEANQSIEQNVDDVLSDEVLSYYFPVPAGEYGFNVRIIDAKNHYMDKATNQDKLFTKGQILGMSTFAFEPTGTLIDVVVNNAEELIDFAANYNKGEYISPNVSLGADIEFNDDQSARFAATGGIGTDDLNGDTNYFNGVFDGKGKTIKGLTSNVPLFAFTGSGGKVKNLNIDSTCEFTVESGQNDFGAIVGRHKGSLSGCNSAATVIIPEGPYTAETNVGGIVGRCYTGNVSDCNVSGSILFPSVLGTKTFRIGGVVGAMDGDSDKGLVRKCSYNGLLKIADDTDFGGPVMKEIYIFAGGIVGLMSDGSIDSCTVSSSASIVVKGQSKSNIGGIVGRINKPAFLVRGCTNSAAITYASDGARADTTPTYIGGITGENGDDKNIGALIEHCSNSGVINVKLNSTTGSFGGIAGYSNGPVKNCSNTADITRNSTTTAGQANRYITIGGCIGVASNNGPFENLTNSGNITCNFPGTSTNTTVGLGGIIGKVSGSATTPAVSVINCINTGTILNSSSGSTSDSIKALLPSMCTGGVVGYINCPVSIEGCINRGNVKYNYNTKGNGRMSNTGGIVGALRATVNGTNAGVPGSSISGCTNFGNVQNINYNNTYSLAGGAICGCIVGTAIGTAESPVQISECINTNDATTNTTYNVKRGYEGGVIGWSEFCSISGCSSSKSTSVYSSNMPAYNGGIAAWCISSTISGCTTTGASLHASASAPCTTGGIAAHTDATTVIENCTVNDILMTYENNTKPENFNAGGIAGVTDPKTIIRGCSFSGNSSVDKGTNKTALTIEDIVSGDSASYTDGGGNQLITK